MLLTAATLHVLLLAVSAVTTTVLAGYAWRNRTEPGSLPFAALMIAVTVWTGSYAAGLVTLDPAVRPLWERIQWFGTATIPVWFLLFVLEYTGKDDLATRRTAAALLMVPAVTIVVVWTNPYHGLMFVENRVVVTEGIALMVGTFGPWFWVYLVYAYGLILVAAGFVLRLVFLSDYLFVDQSLLLLIGTFAPLGGNFVAVFLSTQPLPGLDLTPYAFVVTGIAFGYALFRRRLFDLVPATRQLGRNAAISQLDDGVVIVDSARHVVYLNAAAAELFDCDPTAPLGEPVVDLVDREALTFESEDALAQLERGDATYEVRTSPIVDRRDRLIGHTLVVTDVTARERRERRLARQRDELQRVNELNGVIRGVNAALVSASSRDDMAAAVCDKLAGSDLFRTASMADLPTWTGDADRWTVAGAPEEADDLPTVGETDLEEGASPDVVPAGGEQAGQWTIVPITYGRTVYGALGLLPDQDVGDREREVLGELGDLIGHAINAVETRRLLADEAVVELELRTTDGDVPLLEAARAAGCRFELAGLVPAGEQSAIAYLRVEGTTPESASTALLAADDGDVRTVREGDGAGLLEWAVGGESLLARLAEHGASVTGATVDAEAASFVVEAASDADVRALVERATAAFPDTWLEARRELERPVEASESVPQDGVAALTDRQREAMEAAYRAGYFQWPRESTAEEVADTLDIAAPTLHAHLRKAEDSLLGDLFDGSRRSD